MGKYFKKHYLILYWFHKKRVISTIMFRNWRHHTNEDLKNLEILKLNDINTYFGLSFVYDLDYFTYNFRHINELRPIFAPTKQG